MLIERVHGRKDYKEETLYVAVSLVDRCIEKFTDSDDVPCLVTLSITCLFIAAKIEEEIQPNLNRMVRDLKDEELKK